MKVILLQDVRGIGRKGDIVEAKDGHARNFLIPKGYAAIATESAVREAKHREKSRAIRDTMHLQASKELKEKIEQETFTLAVKAGEKGRIFGSVTNMDIAGALKDAGYEVDRKDILMQAPIKDVGMHVVELRLHSEVSARIKVDVVEE
jgi:large subunit ribosomal protein L9